MARKVSRVIGWALSAYLGFKVPEPPAPPIPIFEPTVDSFGWKKDPHAVREALVEIEKAQGSSPYFEAAGRRIMAQADTDLPVFFWEAELKVLKQILESWNQSSIGSCVSHGWGRGVQDLALIQIALGGQEQWPGAEVNREAIYGGSRVQVGNKGRPDNGGDGSVGAWAAQWVQSQYGGVLFNLKYPSVDLSGGYTVARCRAWGRTGCPVELVPTAKEHPVQTVALVKTVDEAWAAIGNGYPIPVCSGVGFDSPLKEGFCSRRGSWAHCMQLRGRFMHASKGKCFVLQNSWGDYLRTVGNPNSLIDVVGRGKVQLPTGCFGITSADLAPILREADSFAVSAFKGFPPQTIDWFVHHRPAEPGDLFAVLKAPPLKAETQWSMAP